MADYSKLQVIEERVADYSWLQLSKVNINSKWFPQVRIFYLETLVFWSRVEIGCLQVIKIYYSWLHWILTATIGFLMYTYSIEQPQLSWGWGWVEQLKVVLGQ